MSEEIVIFDIDGTLADVSERIHHLSKKPRDWESFFKGLAQDKAIKSMVRLCNILHSSGVKIILCSGRSEKQPSRLSGWQGRASITTSYC